MSAAPLAGGAVPPDDVSVRAVPSLPIQLKYSVSSSARRLSSLLSVARVRSAVLIM